jgi:uncharacterized protein YggE
MKQAGLTLMVLLAALAAKAAPEGQTPPPRTISVSGSAVGYVPQDTILWDITLQTAGKEVVDAKASSDDQVKELTSACLKKEIQGADIAVGIVKIRDARLGEGTGASDPAKPLNVTRVITVRQRDTRLFSEMLEMLSRGKGTKVHYRVVSSRAAQVTRDTTVKATAAAKDKAAAMAAVLGAQIGNVLTINEYPPVGWNTPDENVPIDQSSASFGADAEEIRITVYVTFQIQ